MPQTRRETRRGSPLSCALVAAWLCTIAGGLMAFHRYAGTPGQPGHGAEAWPEATRLPAESGDALVAFLHPMCVCSEATLDELLNVVRRSGAGVRPTVVFVREDESVPAESRLVAQARRNPDMTIVFDDGTEAARFGAATSGDILLYRKGRLVFRGGVTGTRGHRGPNANADQLLAALRGEHPTFEAAAPVFGCALFAEPTR